MGIKPSKGGKSTPSTVTQKHLAADIAASHDLSKKAGEAPRRARLAVIQITIGSHDCGHRSSSRTRSLPSR